MSILELSVEEWYDEADGGERTHMANKLAKHGYPERGVHSRAAIEAASGGPQPTLFDVIGEASVMQVIDVLKDHEVTLEELLKGWLR